MTTQPKLWISLLCLVVLVSPSSWSDVGPEILISRPLDDRLKTLQFYHRVVQAQQEGNYIADIVARELAAVLGPVQGSNLGRSLYGFHKETDSDWAEEVEKRAVTGDVFYMDIMGVLCYGENIYIDGKAQWGNRNKYPADHLKAFSWWEKAAALNSGLANYHLGFHYTRARSREPEKAAKYFRKAGELGVPAAWYRLGHQYDSGELREGRDSKKAREYWEKAASAGVPEAQYYLGAYYYYGTDSDEPNKELGMQLIRAAESNIPDTTKIFLENYQEKYVRKKPVARVLPMAIHDNSTGVVSTYVAFDAISYWIKNPKVSVVCFVDAYEAGTARPAVLPDKNTSIMLDVYLSGLRTIQRRQPVGVGAKAVNPEDIKIFVIECWDDVLVKVREFDKNFQLHNPDNSIPVISKIFGNSLPVIYVFHKGKWVKTYTNFHNPGQYGGDLKSLVEKLLTDNFETNGSKMALIINSLLKPER